MPASSVYGAILAQAIEQLPDARSAVFADWEGEAVDSAGPETQSLIRLAGAHWGIVYYLTREVFRRAEAGTPRVMTLRFAERLFCVQRVTDHYYIVLESRGDAQLARTLHVLDQTRARLLEQM